MLDAGYMFINVAATLTAAQIPRPTDFAWRISRPLAGVFAIAVPLIVQCSAVKNQPASVINLASAAGGYSAIVSVAVPASAFHRCIIQEAIERERSTTPQCHCLPSGAIACHPESKDNRFPGHQFAKAECAHRGSRSCCSQSLTLAALSCKPQRPVPQE